jgi:hypothetical protein
MKDSLKADIEGFKGSLKAILKDIKQGKFVSKTI